ncbi:MAG: tRNA (adenosine(37)-N6)-threonylcarbamoyltransferase complex ATPase subunit type 1 TsaE [Amoebophilaceae bacterium]|nr:tRNA (adenosine(37)-N6)-threonylcarbamoyltransferase complex ATPase subunit type 1 TsaE [Amoebophilaceae bacterium]
MVLISQQEALKETAHALLDYAKNQKIFLLEGHLGSGKTTLIKHLCKLLGVADLVNSPTFTLVNEYQTIEGDSIYHFDCYRIAALREAIVLDFESYFASGGYCFVEWPSKIEAILPLHYLWVQMEIQTPTTRKLTCSHI